MPWLGIRGNGTLSYALPRKFRLVRYARRNENFVLVSGEAASTADAILSRNSYLTARFLRGIKRGAG